MRRILPALALLCALACPAGAQTISGPARIADADSWTINGVKMRAHAYDAPEWDQVCHRGEPLHRAGLGNPISEMRGYVAPYYGVGTYSILAVLHIPDGAGVVSVGFATAGQDFNFMHLDFMPNNKVRVNDDVNQVFGSFTRGQMFTLVVTLSITASSATANIQLIGGSGASGSLENVNLVRQFFPLSLARQFGGVHFYMGANWGGSFQVTDIVITRKN